MTDNQRKVLVVDDEPSNLQLLRQILQDQYQLSFATDGMKALEVALKVKPDIILLDIMMPGMDGYETCKRMKVNPDILKIPIIFVTAMGDVEDESHGFDVGGVDYITKPIRPKILKARVKTHLELKKARDELEKQNQILKENAMLREDVERITRHDLKTPLNPILSYPPLMKKDDNLTEKQVKYIGKMESAGRKMLNMINMSLDLYKMEKGAYDVNSENVNLIQVLDEIKDEMKIRLKMKRLTVETVIDGAAVCEAEEFFLKGEKLLIYSMLANLFKNAVEASSKNEKITFALDHGENLSVSIHNQGAVPEEIRDTIFEKYATAGKSQGTGLGTYSSRLIAETLGGKISLDSSKENETTIHIKFPQEK